VVTAMVCLVGERGGVSDVVEGMVTGGGRAVGDGGGGC